MADHPHSISELKSFRLMKFFRSDSDKGVAFVKVKSLDEELCRKLQKVRKRYLVATSECYYNTPRDINNIASLSRYFDFHIVSCKRIGDEICRQAPGSKYVILGAGEFLTDPNIFRVTNEGERPIDFICSANSFWSVKNFHKVLHMQKYLKDKGILTTSKILCGSLKDKWYYKECRNYIKNHIPGQSEIVLGTSIDGLRDAYNSSKHLVHLSSIDSSPRVVFEAMLCGCHCLLAGRWTESLNSWLQSPLVHIMPDDNFDASPDLWRLPPDLSLSRQYNSQIGMANVFPRIGDFIRKQIQPSFSDKSVIDQSCVGKTTFKQMETEYATEIRRVRGMLSK